MKRIEMIIETLALSPSNNLTRLLACEYFIEVSNKFKTKYFLYVLFRQAYF